MGADGTEPGSGLHCHSGRGGLSWSLQALHRAGMPTPPTLRSFAGGMARPGANTRSPTRRRRRRRALRSRTLCRCPRAPTFRPPSLTRRRLCPQAPHPRVPFRRCPRRPRPRPRRLFPCPSHRPQRLSDPPLLRCRPRPTRPPSVRPARPVRAGVRHRRCP